MAARNESRANPAEQAEMQQRAFELVLRGKSLREAARVMTAEGTRVSHEKVRQLVQLESDERVLPSADQWRQVLIERLNDARQAVLTVLEREQVTILHGRVIREGSR
ncbi:hypothetical protein [Amycolatopsis sp. cmx-8-4]|uniref:hypothetical protein n=1 Tax=Amycolatopsis sp. cmx-8-4 TaxID=2790947 RepID=UPI00397B2DDE